MVETVKHVALVPVSPVFLFRALWLVLVLGTNGVFVSCEKRTAFVSIKSNPFDPHGTRSNDGESHGRNYLEVVAVTPQTTRAWDLSSGSIRMSQSDDDGGNVDSFAAASVPKFWRRTPGGLRMVDDEIGSGEEFSEGIDTVARVRCETQIYESSSSTTGRPRERVVFLESSFKDDSVVLSKDGSGVTLLVVCNENSFSETNEETSIAPETKAANPGFSGLQEALSGMRVGGRRRVLIPPTNKVRFVGLGAAGVNDDTIIMNLQLERIEPASSLNAILARTITSGGAPAAVLLLLRPFLSPLGLLSFLCFVPLIIKKTVNGFAAMELYMDVDADTMYPIKTLLEWKLKF